LCLAITIESADGFSSRFQAVIWHQGQVFIEACGCGKLDSGGL